MIKKIVLAGGCFWGMQDLIRKQPGVVKTTVGYTGGQTVNPTYKDHEGHAEAVEIAYDDELTSYRSAIFYGNQEEKAEAAEFIDIVEASGRWKNSVVTSLEPLGTFYPAEDYHQDYLIKNPGGYTCHFVRFDSYLS